MSEQSKFVFGDISKTGRFRAHMNSLPPGTIALLYRSKHDTVPFGEAERICNACDIPKDARCIAVDFLHVQNRRVRESLGGVTENKSGVVFAITHRRTPFAIIRPHRPT